MLDVASEGKAGFGVCKTVIFDLHTRQEGLFLRHTLILP